MQWSTPSPGPGWRAHRGCPCCCSCLAGSNHHFYDDYDALAWQVLIMIFMMHDYDDEEAPVCQVPIIISNNDYDDSDGSDGDALA